MRLSSHFGIVIRRAPLRDREIGRETLASAMEAEPLDENSDLLSYGPHVGGEASEEFTRRLERLGLRYFSDFFVFQGDFPAWCSFSASLSKDDTGG